MVAADKAGYMSEDFGTPAPCTGDYPSRKPPYVSDRPNDSGLTAGQQYANAAVCGVIVIVNLKNTSNEKLSNFRDQERGSAGRARLG